MKTSKVLKIMALVFGLGLLLGTCGPTFAMSPAPRAVDNVGEARCVVCERSNGGDEAIDLTCDKKVKHTLCRICLIRHFCSSQKECPVCPVAACDESNSCEATGIQRVSFVREVLAAFHALAVAECDGLLDDLSKLLEERKATH